MSKLTRKDFIFEWINGLYCYANKKWAGKISPDGHIDGLFAIDIQNIREENFNSFNCREEAREWVEQQFVDFLNSVLPQDGYREKWGKLYDEMAARNNSSICGLMKQIESSPEKGDGNEVNNKNENV